MAIVNPVDCRGNTQKDGHGVTYYLKVDSDGVLLLRDAGAASVGDGTLNLNGAGSAQQLPDVACRRVVITAHESNSGTVVIGGSTVVGATSGRRGKALFATQSEVFFVSNLNQLYLDGTVTNDDIHYYYET